MMIAPKKKKKPTKIVRQATIPTMSALAYLTLLCAAYYGAPPDSDEEKIIRALIRLAGTRLCVDYEELFSRVCDELIAASIGETSVANQLIERLCAELRQTQLVPTIMPPPGPTPVA